MQAARQTSRSLQGTANVDTCYCYYTLCILTLYGVSPGSAVHSSIAFKKHQDLRNYLPAQLRSFVEKALVMLSGGGGNGTSAGAFQSARRDAPHAASPVSSPSAFPLTSAQPAAQVRILPAHHLIFKSSNSVLALQTMQALHQRPRMQIRQLGPSILFVFLWRLWPFLYESRLHAAATTPPLL